MERAATNHEATNGFTNAALAAERGLMSSTISIFRGLIVKGDRIEVTDLPASCFTRIEAETAIASRCKAVKGSDWSVATMDIPAVAR